MRILILILLVTQVALGQKEYSVPNTQLKIPFPQDDFTYRSDMNGLFSKDSSTFITIVDFKREDEEFVDYLYKGNGIDTLYKYEISGGDLYFNYCKTLFIQHDKDSIFYYVAKIYVDSLNNYLLIGVQKSNDVKLTNNVINSIRDIKIKKGDSIDPFEGKSFWLNLDKVELKLCKEYRSAWSLKLTSDGIEYPEIEDKTYLFIGAYEQNMSTIFEQKLSQSENKKVIFKGHIFVEGEKMMKIAFQDIGEKEHLSFHYFMDYNSKTYEIKGKIHKSSNLTLEKIDEFVKTMKVK